MRLNSAQDFPPAASIDERSVVEHDGTLYFLARRDGAKLLGVRGDAALFEGAQLGPNGVNFCPLTPINAAALRARLPWLRPVPLGLETSVGFGDRLGLATPGHIRALRRVCDAEAAIAPIFAQQSVRENARTGRNPQKVLDDAMWGVFEEGWRLPWGADADHLKTPADVEAFAAARYTLFTIDPGDHVDDTVNDGPATEVEAKVLSLPWEMLEDRPDDMAKRYLGAPIELDESSVTIDRPALWRSAAKYGRAVAHTVEMYREIEHHMRERRFEIEVSVDETESPTTVADHIYIAGELQRLGVRWVGLAPRFVGRFEKGVDYIGDLETFAAEFEKHAAVARAFGPYKLSLHSGSDKFRIYPIAARLTAAGNAASGPLAHLKTAGTSYLEALRTVATVDPELFRDILGLARENYETDRATYHVSAELVKVPTGDELGDEDLPGLLENFDAREVLHVTFGSILDSFGDRLRATLCSNENVYWDVLAAHFERHLRPFVQ